VALEVVLVMPILLMLIIGTFVIGTFLSVKSQTIGLAHDGARRAALELSLPSDTVIVGASCPNSNDYVTVRATQPVALSSIPFVGVVFDDTYTAEATMRCAL
jgi:Flp pilus assembly protein TadG